MNKKTTTKKCWLSHIWQSSLTCTCNQGTPGQLNSVHTHTHIHTHPAFLSASQVNTVDRVCVLCSVLTHYIQGVRVVDGSKLILHQASVVALVRRHHTLHDQGPMLVTDLCLKKKIKKSTVLVRGA